MAETGGRVKKLKDCLHYELKWGQSKEALIKRWKSGKNTPVIDKWPTLLPGLHLYFSAFTELCTDRPQAMSGCLPIPLSSIHDYARFYNFTQEQSEDLIYFVRALDNELIAYSDDKPKNNQNHKPGIEVF